MSTSLRERAGAMAARGDFDDAEPFSDHERAAAGLPPLRTRRGPSGTSRASFVRDMRERDDENSAQYRSDESGPENESRTPREVPASVRRGAKRAYRDTIDAGGQTASATRSILSARSPGSVAGVILGLAGYAIIINYVRYGWPGVRGWFAAKFLNKPFNPNDPNAKVADVIPFPGPGTQTTAPSAPGTNPPVAKKPAS